MIYLRVQILLSFFATAVTARALTAYDVDGLSSTIASRAVLADTLALRILPMGDSITYGYGSSDSNGYRKRLRDLLINNTVTYVGSVHSGNMTNNDNEGWPGANIVQIGNDVQKSGTYAKRPNLVLLMAGTNDMTSTDAVASGAPQRLGTLLDQIQSACPDAAIIAAQITPNKKAANEARVKVFNAAIPAIIAARSHVLTVNMSVVPTSELKDSVHPVDAGYQLMAEAWLGGIEKAIANGWITPPVSVSGS